MKPLDFPEANRTFTAPEGMTAEECNPLRLLDNGYELQSLWQPDAEEAARLAAGAPVVLTVLGRGHPPVQVEVGAAPVKPADLVVAAAVEADLAALETEEGTPC